MRRQETLNAQSLTPDEINVIAAVSKHKKLQEAKIYYVANMQATGQRNSFHFILIYHK